MSDALPPRRGIPGSRGCTAITRAGGACNAQALTDEPFCFVHSPEHVEAAAEARRLGGQRRRREGALVSVLDLIEPVDSPAGLHRLLAIATHDALSLDLSVARTRLLLGVVHAAIRLREVDELETRVRELEAALAAKSGYP
jgi:hypothetical protein